MITTDTRDHVGMAVMITRDGGRSWSTRTLRAEGITPQLECVTTTDCWVLGVHRIFFTHDGGRTWRSERTPSFRRRWVQYFSCATARRCWAGVIPDRASDHTPERIFATRDGGTSWKPVLRLSSHKEYLSRLSCTAPATCWAFDSLLSGRRVLSTSDGWQHWRVRKLPQESKVALIRCATASVCYPLGNTVAEMSTDAGGSWTSVSIPRRVARWGGLADISCPTATRCWAVGVAGIALTSRGFTGTPGGIITTRTLVPSASALRGHRDLSPGA